MDDSMGLSPRQYQKEIVDIAANKNSIIKLGTGSGKTFISIMCMRQFLHKSNFKLNNGGQRIVFLVKNVPLVRQQALQIQQGLFLEPEEVGQFVGYSNGKWIDNWTGAKWTESFEKCKILVMIADIFRDILHHAKIKLSFVSLLVLDECHHASKKDSYVQICNYIFDSGATTVKPHIIGLSACIFNGNIKANPISLEAKMQELEELMHSKIITSTSSDAEVFRQNSRVIFKYYAPYCTNETSNNSDKLLDALTAAETWAAEQLQYNQGIGPDISTVKLVKKTFTDAKKTLQDVGEFGCFKVLQLYKDEIKKQHKKSIFTNQIYKNLLQNSLQKLTECSLIYEKRVKFLNTVLSSFKCNALADILQNSYHSLSKKETFRALVFTEERMLTYAVKEYLDTIKNFDSDCSFFRVEHITGHGMDSFGPKEASMDLKVQNAILHKFRSGECNILVATRVIEEGMDIQDCNLVVRFDFPKEFRSYIQSRGRARAKNSNYVLLIPEENRLEYSNKIRDYDILDNMTQQLLHLKRNLDFDDDDDNFEIHANEDDSNIYVTKTGAKCNVNTALNMLNRYINTLPYRSIRPPCAHFMLQTIPQDGSLGNLFQARVTLPRPSPLLDTIVGPKCVNKKTAKQTAAVEVVKQLHQIKELDDHLLPIKNIIDEEDISDNQLDTRNIHNKEKIQKGVASILKKEKLHFVNNFYIYRFVVCESPIQSPSSDNQNYPILLSQTKLPQTVSFPVFIGTSCQFLILQDTNCFLYLTSKQLDFLVQVQKNICSLFLRKSSIDIDFSASNHCLSLLVAVGCDVDKTCNVRIQWDILHSLYDQSFKIRSSEPKEVKPGRLVQLINEEHTSSFYYCQSANHERAICKRVWNMDGLVYKHNYKADFYSKRQNTEMTFMIKDIIVYKLDVELWTNLRLVPVVLYRLNQLCLANELLDNILSSFTNNKRILNNLSCCLQVPERQDSSLGSGIKSEEEYSVRCKDLSHDLKGCSKLLNVELQDVLSAVTLTGAQDIHNLELFEVIGDSFLKYIISTQLYASTDYKTSEGKLTKKKICLINNAFLYKQGKKKSLERFLFGQVQIENRYMLPVAVPVLQDEAQHERFYQVISDKSVADSVEALIGLFLVKGSPFFAKKVLDWFDIEFGLKDVCLDNGDQVIIFPKRSSPFIYPNISDNIQEQLSVLAQNYDFETLEKVLGYSFNNRGYLLEALSHPSSTVNIHMLTDSYQRLEFLGDAVVDYLVTRYITVRQGNLTPGQVTDLRSALTNNSFFAVIVVQKKLYKHLLHFDDKLNILINSCVNKISELDNPFEFYSDIFLDDSSEMTTIKVLGDLFESLMGAVFVDSNYNLLPVWNIMQHLMKHPLIHFQNHIPVNPVRCLYETCQAKGIKIQFLKEKVIKTETEQLISMELQMQRDGVWVTENKVSERNFKLCKIKLASLYLASLQDGSNNCGQKRKHPDGKTSELMDVDTDD